jgi:hypothetical protein
VNTYTGATTIAQYGDLLIGVHGSIADSVGVTDNGVLDISEVESTAGAATTVSIIELSGAGVVDLGDNTLSVTNSGAITSFTGTLTGTGGSLEVYGGGIELGGVDTNTYSGATKVYGTLELDNSIADSNVSLKTSSAELELASAASVGSLSGVTGSLINLGRVAFRSAVPRL